MFRHQLSGKPIHAGDVLAWSVQACYKSQIHRIASHGEHDRNRRRCSFRRETSLGVADDECYPTSYKVGCQIRQAIGLIFSPSILNENVPAFDVPGFLETHAERCDKWRPSIRRRAVKESDHRRRRLLRRRHDRPAHGCAAEGCNKVAPPHAEHRGCLQPPCAETGRAYRTLNLPQMARQVLGADLNRPESKWGC
jgi:hypothetical protein